MTEGRGTPKGRGAGNGGRKSASRAGDGTPKTGRPALCGGEGTAEEPAAGWKTAGPRTAGRGRPAPSCDRQERGGLVVTGRNRQLVAAGRNRERPAAVRAVMARRATARGAPRGPRPPIGRGGHHLRIASASLHRAAMARTAEQHVLRRPTGPAVPRGRQLAMGPAGQHVPPRPTGPAVPRGRRPATGPAAQVGPQRPMQSAVPRGRLALAPQPVPTPGPSAGTGRGAPASGRPGETPVPSERRDRGPPPRAGIGEDPPAADAGPGMRPRGAPHAPRVRIVREAATGLQSARPPWVPFLPSRDGSGPRPRSPDPGPRRRRRRAPVIAGIQLFGKATTR